MEAGGGEKVRGLKATTEEQGNRSVSWSGASRPKSFIRMTCDWSSEKSRRPEALLSQSTQERRNKYDCTISSFPLARAHSSGRADHNPGAGTCIPCDCRQ